MHSSLIRTAHLMYRGGGGCLHPGEVCIHGGLGRPPFSPVNRTTHRCKNITLPQTSLAGGKKESSEEHQKGNLDAANNLAKNIHYHISQLSKKRDVSEETIFRNLSFFQTISFVHIKLSCDDDDCDDTAVSSSHHTPSIIAPPPSSSIDVNMC